MRVAILAGVIVNCDNPCECAFKPLEYTRLSGRKTRTLWTIAVQAPVTCTCMVQKKVKSSQCEYRKQAM